MAQRQKAILGKRERNMINNIIQLRKILKSDWQYFLKWWKNKKLVKLTSGVYEKSDDILKGYFFKMLNSAKNHNYLILLDKKPIGNVSITHKNKSTFEMHIVIGEKEYWGKGFGTSATKEALKIAFNKLGYEKAYFG
ncbi:MAG: hypothetical protein COV84_04220 [Candidatus Portnoybacteria bacterium CG11_big_fil_rev_8_21_14_0_20_40_15]|uniref:N-acetyltransferase domain-containing protein n=2 Tax=Candidatus Portnoyibacteriota TaxID=1817913 RepID=A0A2H0KRX2_9BACT|nr:MAG: hypothetical protein COV84_04220 [Candidatus Portnoybacteria bacterium CG11_big_fil_rev_8_21_14_0_20_40_15]PIY74114.1 MAG: hypothetical protein COY85_04170 [Candidatus Portnoybacteria bacterium CG_4_10_14_0_8_um_filter_40_50]